MEGTTETGGVNTGTGTTPSAGGAQNDPNGGVGAGTNTGTGNGAGNGDGKQAPNTPLSTEALDKYINERVARATEALNREKSNLQKALDKANKANKSADEVRELENQRRENELAEREREIKARENKIFAMEQIKKAGLDKGGVAALELADIIVADTEDEMIGRVNSLSNLVKALVKSEVDETFKKHGRNPGSGDGGAGKGKPENALAKKLGEQTAARNKQARTVLDYYK